MAMLFICKKTGPLLVHMLSHPRCGDSSSDGRVLRIMHVRHRLPQVRTYGRPDCLLRASPQYIS